jgi:hypothetical protein
LLVFYYSLLNLRIIALNNEAINKKLGEIGSY